MLWHPESEALSVVIIFRISTKQATLISRFCRPAGAEQGEQTQQCNVFVHGSSHFSAISLKEADRSEHCFGAIVTNMPACAPTFCTNAKRSARARKSLFRNRWHLELCRSSLLPANVHCAHPVRTHLVRFSLPTK